jgi:hypothetical protein
MSALSWGRAGKEALAMGREGGILSLTSSTAGGGWHGG